MEEVLSPLRRMTVVACIAIARDCSSAVALQHPVRIVSSLPSGSLVELSLLLLPGDRISHVSQYRFKANA
jgi:hypothetical protein